jgi:hypothetical protein
MDTTGAANLDEARRDLSERGIVFAIAAAKGAGPEHPESHRSDERDWRRPLFPDN